ncbi:glycosyltransferase family 4 protein [Spongisporangium articulatum]|uniref:Glycosyltransferase family 4 protein n=1 Tax=Spongisporangium articulatum TaxID=3362603 RepID=A0ABW8AN68_9ACTN
MTTAKGRVLHVVWEYPPVIYGGLARHAEALTRAQADAGWDVHVLTAAEDVTQPERRVPGGTTHRRGITVHRARRRRPRTGWDDLLTAAGELEDALLATGTALMDGVSVVHAHDWIGARAAAVLARRAGVPLVVTVHATEWGRHAGRIGPTDREAGDPASTETALVHALERQAVVAAAAVIVCSNAMRDEVVAVLDADPARVHVVPNAVDADAWRCGRASVREARRYWLTGATVGGARPDVGENPRAAGRPGAPTGTEDGPLIVAAGRLEWEKGFSTLIRAMPSLRKQFPGLRVVLAGRGGYAGRLCELAADLGVLDSLVMPGWLAGRDLAALYAASDAVVVPSRYEPSGLVAREAQAAGATVVTTDVGGLADAVVPGRTGERVKVGDVHGLHDTLAQLVRDPVRAHGLADAGRVAVQSLTWPDVAARTLALYPS